ncbi:metallophosphoesterase family protein [Deinococcus hohokamensis]|uniref:Metallophosphoesterase family protein n=1 Tax=Deinococcus hohokamensis TaxID=309883 RepID=A0ABV9IBB3_9DEIO
MPSDLRVAVFSDVHGNGFAMAAVAADIRRQGPDLCMNLGDQLWGQADPVRALEQQQSLDAVEVRGNNDERLIMPAADLGPALAPLQAWLAPQIPAAELQRIAPLPTTASLAGGAVLAAHGTPASPWDSLLLGWNSSGYVRRPEPELRQRLPLETAAEVVLVGHMHREDVRHLDGRLLVSVGPVSAQGDGDPRARWALLTRRAGRWAVEARRVVYDWNAADAWERQHGPLAAVDHARPPELPLSG